MNGPQALEMTGFLALGLGAGTLYFLLLRYSVDRIVRHGAALQALPMLLVRAGAVLLVFWFAARTGLWPLLTTGAGFLAARSAILLIARRGT